MMSLRNKLSDKQKKNILALLYSRHMVRDFIFCFVHRLAWRPDWRFYGLPIICHRGSIQIGRRFTACSDPRYNSLGVFQRVTLKVGRNAELIIGDDVGVSGCTISVSCSIRIGDRVLLGSGCMIADSDAHPLYPMDRRFDQTKTASKPVIIEDDVFIGARAIILKGVHIGRGSVVGAGAVVTRDVPPMTVVAGNPAVVVKELDKGPVSPSHAPAN